MARSFQCIRALLAFPLLLTASARGSTEPPGGYDGRSLAMGGTGAAYIHNASAIYHNPASLDGVKSFTATLDFTGSAPRLTSPVSGDGTSVSSDFSVYPLFLAGAAYRLTDRIVIGVAAYPTGGFGSTYSRVPSYGGQDLKFRILILEATPTISVMLVDHLSVGLGYRITYAKETAHAPSPPGMPPTDASLSGTNFAGFHLGAYYQPDPDWELAFTYRSKVNTSLSGTTTQGSTSQNTTSSFASPHTFKVGASHGLFRGALLLALDFKYLLFSESNQELVTTVGTFPPQHQPLNWRDVLSVSFGAEYRLNPLLALRAGYSISQSATPASTANFFTVPPGVINSFHAGAGISLTGWDFDLGALYEFNGGDNLQPQGAPAGSYRLRTVIFAASITFRS